MSAPAATPIKPNKDTSDFLVTEYAQIAQAFSQASTQTTTLFNYYITLVTAPLTLIVAVFGLGNFEDVVTLDTLALENLPAFIGYIVAIISGAGFLMSISISDSRFDALLYARTVNEIRHFFSDKDKRLIKYLKLPIDGTKPEYNELRHFRAMGAQLILVSLLDAFLLFISLSIVNEAPVPEALQDPSIMGWAIAFFGLHLGTYSIFAYWRQKLDHKLSAAHQRQTS